jgi:hypothetical protein
MKRLLEHSIDSLLNMRMTRRGYLRFLIGAAGLCLGLPHSEIEANTQTARGSILEDFLGEELTYHIGFWLIPHCGEAKARFLETKDSGVYRASLEGRTVGVMDLLIGRYRYSYVSYLELSPAGDCLRPRRFEHTQKGRTKKLQRSVTFDYARREITFSQVPRDGTLQEEKIPMREGLIYEDYLTLFYNFRHGSYGPLQRGHTYNLPLHIHKGMTSVDLSIAPRGEEERRRHQELKKDGKEYFLRFRVNQEDVSSTSGEIEGWLSREAVPMKGTIKDVILFGDLWGNLIERKIRGAPQRL